MRPSYKFRTANAVVSCVFELQRFRGMTREQVAAVVRDALPPDVVDEDVDQAAHELYRLVQDRYGLQGLLVTG